MGEANDGLVAEWAGWFDEGHVLAGPWGDFLYLTPPWPSGWPAAGAPASAPSPAEEVADSAVEPAPAAPSGALAGLAEVLALPPEEVLFLDLETCGLHEQPLFLVGTLMAGQLGLFFARRMAEEPATIAAVAERLATASAVVTFNGATFDLPFLRRRAARFDIYLPLPRLQLDLLPLARQVWGRRFGNCRLQTLERAVCGLLRPGVDIPSAKVPGAYLRYQQTGEAAHIAPVLAHNAMDLASTAHLLSQLVQAG